MRVLVTFPGKHGDVLWGMLTARAISEAIGEPVDLLTTPKYGSLLPLLKEQPYIGQAASWPSWEVQESAPMTPWSPFEETLHHRAEVTALGPGYAGWDPYDYVIHLGYRAWPDQPLPFCIYAQTKRLYPDVPIAPLTVADLQRPWITVPPGDPWPAILRPQVAYGFSEEYFELKVGLWKLLTQRFPRLHVNISTTPRWQAETPMTAKTWAEAASWLAVSRVAVCCNSALHVLAVGVGTPVVMMEPNPQRYNEIFYPLGKSGHGVALVLGMDGLPTFDARHVGDAVEAALRQDHFARKAALTP